MNQRANAREVKRLKDATVKAAANDGMHAHVSATKGVWEDRGYVLTHTSIRPIDQWAAKDGCSGPPINRANGRPIHQWAQPTHQ